MSGGRALSGRRSVTDWSPRRIPLATGHRLVTGWRPGRSMECTLSELVRKQNWANYYWLLGEEMCRNWMLLRWCLNSCTDSVICEMSLYWLRAVLHQANAFLHWSLHLPHSRSHSKLFWFTSAKKPALLGDFFFCSRVFYSQQTYSIAFYMLRHNYRTRPPGFNWHNLVNMRFICINISDNIAERMLNLRAW